MGIWIETLVASAHERLDERVREALWARGASDDQIQSFQLGHLDGELPELPEGQEYPKNFLEWSGNGAKLVDAFVFPLTNPLGEIKGLQFRSADRSKGEYMDFFLDRFEPVFLGLGQAMPHVWKSEEIVLVEGPFDFFPVQRVKANAIPTLTARISETLLRTLRRLVQRLVLFYDGDQIGRRVTEKIIKEHGAEFEIRALDYPRGVTLSNGKAVKDPADLWEAWGDDRFNPFLKSQLE
jgi:DNA primase